MPLDGVAISQLDQTIMGSHFSTELLEWGGTFCDF